MPAVPTVVLCGPYEAFVQKGAREGGGEGGLPLVLHCWLANPRTPGDPGFNPPPWPWAGTEH